jgi:hypothetical protein
MKSTGRPATRCGFRTASFRATRNTASGRARTFRSSICGRKSGAGLKWGFRQRSGGRPRLDGQCSRQRRCSPGIDRPRIDHHQLRFARRMDTVVVELLFSHGSDVFFSAGSISDGGQAKFRWRALDEPEGPDEFSRHWGPDPGTSLRCPIPISKRPSPPQTTVLQMTPTTPSSRTTRGTATRRA